MPVKKSGSTNSAIATYQKVVGRLTLITYISLAISIIAIILAVVALVFINNAPAKITTNVTQNTTQFGSTLAGIDQPLNSSELSVINNAPDSYYERAGEMFLNGSIQSPYEAGLPTHNISTFVANGKISVIYIGSITCVYCGENRWAMALALSRFGSFSNLYNGYSSFGDADLPTLYWTQVNYNGSSDYIGNGYSSSYINFLSVEDTHPIKDSFNLNSLPQMINNIKSAGNATYIEAFNYALAPGGNASIGFQGGTPYTIWGNSQFNGADAIDFGNISAAGTLQLTYMTHAQVLNELSNPNNSFGLVEYAGADIYVASLCRSLSASQRAVISACSLPAIEQIQTLIK